MYYVYIIKLENHQYYTGYSENLSKRLQYHKNKAVPTTKRIKPIKLVYHAGFDNKKKALDFEKYLKSSSGFAFRNKRLI